MFSVTKSFISRSLTGAIRAFLQEEQGQDLIEYALILVFLALASMSAFRSLTSGITNLFASVSATLTSAS